MQAANRAARSSSSIRRNKERKLSRLQAPDDLSPLDWQRALRRQFGREQAFALENAGVDPFFSDFQIGNPQSKSRYRVAIRGLRSGDNFCSLGAEHRSGHMERRSRLRRNRRCDMVDAQSHAQACRSGDRRALICK